MELPEMELRIFTLKIPLPKKVGVSKRTVREAVLLNQFQTLHRDPSLKTISSLDSLSDTKVLTETA